MSTSYFPLITIRPDDIFCVKLHHYCGFSGIQLRRRRDRVQLSEQIERERGGTQEKTDGGYEVMRCTATVDRLRTNDVEQIEV